MSLRELARRGRRTGGFRTVMLVLVVRNGDADATGELKFSVECELANNQPTLIGRTV
jgi:hypothetical protein